MVLVDWRDESICMNLNKSLAGLLVALLVCSGAVVLSFAAIPETVRYTRGSLNDFFYTPEFLYALLPDHVEEIELFHSFAEEAAPDLDGATFVELQSEDRVRERIHRILMARGFESYGTTEYEKNRYATGWKIVRVSTKRIGEGKTAVDVAIRHMDSLF